MALLPTEGAKPADGDLLVITARDTRGVPYLLASFHGDTDGLATAPTLQAVHALALTLPEHVLVFGLDANTCTLTHLTSYILHLTALTPTRVR